MSKPPKLFSSPKFNKILDLVAQRRKDKVPMTQIYTECKRLDPDLPCYDRFAKFFRKYDKQVSKNRGRFMVDANSQAINDLDFLAEALDKARLLGDIVMEETLKEVSGYVERKEEIPWKIKKTVMGWFLGAGKLTVQQEFLKIKKVDTAANLKALSLLANAARYQSLKPEDIEKPIIDGEILNNEDEQAEQSLPTIEPGGAGVDTGDLQAREIGV